MCAQYHEGIDTHLINRLLPAQLLIHGFVDGDSRCNYEVYLTELLNQSSFFMSRSGNNPFKYCEKQDDGQCDAIAKEYEIDFKLLESSSRIEAARMHAHQIHVTKEGTVYSAPLMQENIIVTRLHSCLRSISSFEELDGICKAKPPYVKMQERCEDNVCMQVQRDLYDFIHTLKKEKNLLYFIPEEFDFTDCNYDEKTKMNKIREALVIDFSMAFAYRKSKLPDYSIFLSCIYKKQMLFYEFREDSLVLVDIVELSLSDTYTYLMDRYAEW